MTQPLPELVVSIDREAAIRLRSSIRTSKTVSAWIFIALGLVGIAGTITVLISALRGPISNPVFVVFLIAPVVVAVALLAYGVHQVRLVARQGAYWRAEDLPERAFVVTADGLHVASDEPSGTQSIPWESVVGLRLLGRKLEFTVIPGALTERARTSLQYGYAMLDQDRAVIAQAVRQLSGDRVIAQ